MVLLHTITSHDSMACIMLAEQSHICLHYTTALHLFQVYAGEDNNIITYIYFYLSFYSLTTIHAREHNYKLLYILRNLF